MTAPSSPDFPPWYSRLEAFIEVPFSDLPSSDLPFNDIPSKSEESFTQLARDVFAYQFERVEPFRRLARSRGVEPGQLDDWRQIPPVPVAAFKSMTLAAAPAREVFRSSGTTVGAHRRSVHHHPFPELYRRVIERLFPLGAGPGERAKARPQRRPFLSLVAPRDVIPDSSLGFMVDHLQRCFGAQGSRSVMGAESLDFRAAQSWVAQLEGRGGVVFSTAFGLAWWLDHLEEHGERLKLPEGSVIFETGGFKGRAREIERVDLLRRIEHHLGVPPSRVVREYGMSELTGHFYTEVLSGGDGDLFTVPHFMRVQALEPESLRALPLGEPGLLAILDLANAGSAMHLLTEDLGVIEPRGFRLIGRASGAELRGCSLTVDEIRP